MALVVVLWLVVLLSVMAVGHARNTHTEMMLASRHVDFARARALAEAGINHVILELLADSREQERPTDGSVFTLNLNDQKILLAIRDARGLVDLNAASASLLDATLRACGVEQQQASKLVDAILDWRDADNLAHLNGIEDPDYRAAGLPWTSRDSAFETVDELKYLLGMRQELFDRVAPLVTIYSERAGIDLQFAPPLLVSALGSENIPGVSNRTTARPTLGARNGTYHIYASVSGTAGAIASIEAVVKISGGSEYAYSLLDWREPPRVQFPPLDGGQG